MLSPLCSFWPLLAAGLVGWLLCGWFARQFLRDGPATATSPPEPPYARRSIHTFSWQQFRRIHWSVAALLGVILLVTWMAGFGAGGRACKVAGASASATVAAAATTKPAARQAAAAPSAPAAPASAAPAAAAASAPPSAKLYFPLDRTKLPPDTVRTLLPLVTHLKANPSAKASPSGFHDATGNRARNEALALDRARAVRGALERAGIARDRVVLQKPGASTVSDAAREARRVEVSVQGP